MTLRVLVLAEDELGMTLARDLCDRVVVERGSDWLVELWSYPALRETQRAWTGISHGESLLKWRSLNALSRERRVVMHVKGLRGYGIEAGKAARLAATCEPRPDLLVLCRDTDGRESVRQEMQDGLEQARADVPVVLAVAHQECEAWVIAGFFATNGAEKALLDKLQSEHGFDPTLEPHRLTAGKATEPHDAKRVHDALLPAGSSSERARQCWLDTPLLDLGHRGARTGLPDYLREVESVVLPLLGAFQRTTSKK